MYTQCPDCERAFKVTADVLKQAAGMVLCGGCGNAFNALTYLSEQMPRQQPTPQKATAAPPELMPEKIETDDGLLKSISAAQSAALLKTLDDLAGSDIRIEDTGIEWRVLDEEDAAEPAADDDLNLMGIANVDEYLDDTETPIDEFLMATPDVVDAPEIFAAAANDAPEAVVAELRFDDNTPLPDDFAREDEPSHVSTQEPKPQWDGVEDRRAYLPQEAAANFELSEPGEWTDIFGEFHELALDIAAPVDSIVENGSTDEAPVPAAKADVPLDMDTQFALADELAREAGFDEEIAQLDLIIDQPELMDEPVVAHHSIEDELAGGDSEDRSEDQSGAHVVPAMTEAEHTVNMLIDQDLMAFAIEDGDGFASTIIIPDEAVKKKAREEKARGVEFDLGHDEEDEAPGFETIILEGESIRSAFDSKKLAADAADAAAASKLVNHVHSREGDTARHSGLTRYKVIAGLVLLVVVLAVQAMHQSREALATIPAFSNTVGQVYRALGQPVQPAWDITGWRFEATKGNVEGDEEELTIYSRLGNSSDGPLPYPLIGISLTDRFEESIGSRILDPAEYLPTDLDLHKLVPPGNTFNAVITIKSATETATGFKLNVCYRSSDGQLRCAIDDFK